MTKILVLGAGGQLGQCIRSVAEGQTDLVFFYATEQDANILHIPSLVQLVQQEKPSFIVNCAAYTAVDLAEDEPEQAAAVNDTGAANIAAVCSDHNIKLIHISTDFVFEGNTVKLLTEEDLTSPINVYGQTKLDGEQAIQALMQQYYIIRTSWLYAEYGANFVKTMLKLSADRDQLNIIADQVGTPTYAIDLATTIVAIVKQDKDAFGIYHYSNEGVTSWFDFARAIFSLKNINITVNPIPSTAYPTRAKRPAFSVMDKTKIKKTFNLEIPYWKDSLGKCLDRIV